MHRLKSVGYLVSIVSVVLLAIASWSNASKSTLLMACLLSAVGASIIGMFCRWLAYEIEDRRKDTCRMLDDSPRHEAWAMLKPQVGRM